METEFKEITGWKPFEQIGNFLRIVEYKGREMIQACPMLQNGAMSSEDESCDVEEEDTLYKDLFGLPDYSYTEEHDDWRQALRELIKAKK